MAQARPYSCGIDPAIDVIGGKWKPLILWALDAAPRRPGALRRMIPGISEKMLVQQLRSLEVEGIVRSESFGEIPPRVEYSLTPFGRSLNLALVPLGVWGARNVDRITAGRQRA